MSASGPLEVYLDDVVRLRRQHPCGGFDWTVVRLGADIGLRCLTCGHRIMLPRTQLERRVRTFVSRPRAEVEEGGTGHGSPGPGAVGEGADEGLEAEDGEGDEPR